MKTLFLYKDKHLFFFKVILLIAIMNRAVYLYLTKTDYESFKPSQLENFV